MRLRAEADPQLPAGLGLSANLATTWPALSPRPERSGPSRGPRTLVGWERGRRPDGKVLGSTGPPFISSVFQAAASLSRKPREPLTTHFLPVCLWYRRGSALNVWLAELWLDIWKTLGLPGRRRRRPGEASLSELYLYPWWAINPLGTFAPLSSVPPQATSFLASAILNHTLG